MNHPVKVFLLGFVSLLLPSCGKKPLPRESDSTAPVQTYALLRLNYMRFKMGQFISGSSNGVAFTTRRDLTTSMDHLLATDSSIVVYFHGGFISAYNAFTMPLTSNLDNTFRTGRGFPYYVLYGASLKESLWPGSESEFADDKAQFGADTITNKIDSLVEKISQQNSYRYIVSQLFDRISFGASSLSPYQYRPITDTIRLKSAFQPTFSAFATVNPSPENEFLNSRTAQKDLQDKLELDTELEKYAREELSENNPDTTVAFTGIRTIRRLYDLGRIINGIARRFRNKRDHGFINTCFEETVHYSTGGLFQTLKTVARSGWKNSKTIVKLPFGGDGARFGGTALLDELARITAADSASDRKRKIFLIGSSTGTILLCNLLRMVGNNSRYSNLSLNVIFSVPSCTIEDFASALSAADKNIKSFWMFGLSEADESTAGPPIAYTGSVLYLASGICESEDKFHDELLVGMQRSYQKRYRGNKSLNRSQRNALIAVSRYLKVRANGESSMIGWSNLPPVNPILNNGAKKHGEVIRDRLVQNCIRNILIGQQDVTLHTRSEK